MERTKELALPSKTHSHSHNRIAYTENDKSFRKIARPQTCFYKLGLARQDIRFPFCWDSTQLESSRVEFIFLFDACRLCIVSSNSMQSALDAQHVMVAWVGLILCIDLSSQSLPNRAMLAISFHHSWIRSFHSTCTSPTTTTIVIILILVLPNAVFHFHSMPQSHTHTTTIDIYRIYALP